MSLRNFKSIEERRIFLEKKRRNKFPSLSIYPPQLQIAQNGNCENMIGAIHIPLGVAGPLRINGEYAKGEYYIPLATTEGALVASVNRGCKAITAAGGVSVYCEVVGVSRASIFQTNSLGESMQLKRWIEQHMPDLNNIAAKTSSHIKLLNVFIQITGRQVYVRFSYNTSDAMGMNMVTIATASLAQFIKEKTHASLITLAGNFDVDKKAAWLNFILGRGRKVWAETVLSAEVVDRILKTTPEIIHEVVIQKCLKGSALSGSLGFNAHFANVIAAMFLATGQDAAHIVEGSLGVTSTELTDGKLAIAIMLPDVLIGVVGGGTCLPAQQEALQLLGVSESTHGENASQLAEIVAGTVLAGEISLLASLAAGTLATTHQRFRRKKNV